MYFNNYKENLYILKDLQSIIEYCNLKVKVVDYKIVLYNQHCSLNIYSEGGAIPEIDLEIKNKDDYYPLKVIPEWGFNQSFPKYSQRNKDFTDSEYYKIIIETYLKEGIKNGNFDWLENYEKREKRGKIKYEKLWGLHYEHPIYQKFKNGDQTWEKDIEDLLEDNVSG